MHFCVCEITKDDYTGLFMSDIIEDFVDDEKSAYEFCSSMLDFSKTLNDVHYCVCCLSDDEYIQFLNNRLLSF